MKVSPLLSTICSFAVLSIQVAWGAAKYQCEAYTLSVKNQASWSQTEKQELTVSENETMPFKIGEAVLLAQISLRKSGRVELRLIDRSDPTKYQIASSLFPLGSKMSVAMSSIEPNLNQRIPKSITTKLDCSAL